MASSRFKVSLDSIEGLADRMDRVAGDFKDLVRAFENDMGTIRRGVSRAADADPVGEGVDEFYSKWTDGMHRIRKRLDAVADRLHFAVDSYRATEKSIVDAATPKD